MQRNYDEALRRLLVHEGGYSNHPSDPGGPTNYGITLVDYKQYINPAGTASDVQHMAVDEAKVIYKAHYARPVQFDLLTDGVDYATFDYAVNSGIARASRVLQRCVGLSGNQVDGEIGATTLAYVRVRDPKLLVASICDERLDFLKSLKTWSVFGGGWGTRVREVRAAATMMAAQSQGVIPNTIPIPRTTFAPTPPWMQRLDAILGLYEFPGGRDNPAIVAMAKACGGAIAQDYDHDEIPWCALTENYILKTAGLPGTDSLLALSFRKYGVKLNGPAVGAIATKTRQGGGHVFNVVGRTPDGALIGRGGNQSDMVCDTLFNVDECQFNWPEQYPIPLQVGMDTLPVLKPLPKTKKEFALLPATAPLPGDVMARGEPQAPPIKQVVGYSTAGEGGSMVGLWDWIGNHPMLVAGMIVAGVIVIGGVAYVLWRNHHAQKITPMPLVPVAA